MLNKVIASKGATVKKKCFSCHNPAWKENAKRQKPSAEGVTCVTCHQIADGHPSKKLASGVLATLVPKRSPNNEPQELCLSCHSERKTSAGVPICTTGSENEHAGKMSCIECHMEKADGPPNHMGSLKKQHRSHNFPGGHRPIFMKDIATLSLELDDKNNEIVTRVTPKRIGHDLPTGPPLRYITVELIAFDKKGVKIWTNRPESSELLADRDSIFMRVFSNKDGKAPVPPFLSVGQPDDNRLKERRELRYKRPRNATRFKARLVYHLATPLFLQKAKVPESWATPIEITTAELDMSQ